jgi:hypothetical protein
MAFGINQISVAVPQPGTSNQPVATTKKKGGLAGLFGGTTTLPPFVPVAVNVVDNYLIMEFFSDTVHRHKYDIDRFKMVDYYAHINELLNGIGIDSVDAENIKKTNVAYTHLTNLIVNRLYVNSDSKEYTDLIVSKDNTKYNLPKASELRKTMKEEVDNNPMLKYIMGTVSVKCGIRNLTSKNPILNSTDSYNRSNDWACKVSDDMVDLLRIQLSSLIK